jgi:hypothetical protein
VFWSSGKLDERGNCFSVHVISERGMKNTLVLRRCEEEIFRSTPHLVLEAMEISLLSSSFPSVEINK